jgi:putative ABC transport system permease protein
MKWQERLQRALEGLLRHVAPLEDIESLSGDFAELYGRHADRRGKHWARAWYVFQLLRLFPGYLTNCGYWSYVMFKNYLKISLRNMRRFKAYSFINVAGLAVGIACCLLIFLYVRDELNYDLFHEKADRIYRLVDGFDVEGDSSRLIALSSAPFAPALQREFPLFVEDAVRFFPGRRRMVEYGDKKLYEDGLIFADASLFSVFTVPLSRGDAETALTAPGSLVVSESMAAKYFGRIDPLNQILRINDQEFLVTAVMRDIPRNSHFHADMFASLKTLEEIPSVQERYFRSWARHEFYTYLLLREGTSGKELEKNLPGFIQKHASQEIRSTLGGTLFSRLQPLKDIHLRSNLQHEISPTGDIKNVTIFGVIAAFILLIACVNFMNLATARSASRAREVGLRKVVGAVRSQIVKQFLGEALLFTFIALAVSVFLVVLALPSFSQLTEKTFTLRDLMSPGLAGAVFLVLILVGITSGGHPAYYISRYQPASVLRGTERPLPGRSLLRKGLVVFQFGISTALIVSTLVVLGQLDLLRNRKLGFDKDHVVIVPIRDDSLRKNHEAVKAELMRNPNIVSATLTIGVPGGVVAGDAIQLVTEDGKRTLTVKMIYTDFDYIETMGMEIVQGRDFSRDMGTDTNEAFIINEAAVRTFQLEDPLNTRFEWGDKQGRVIGVVRDFQFQSLKEEITPLVIHIWTRNTYVFAFRIRSEDTPTTLAYIEDRWKELDPGHPFEYSFLDETFDSIYRSEARLGQIFTSFAVLAICIASLGLFGLALFTAQQRTKEIGIRKVLGASIGGIFLLLSREFALLVLIANLFAWPLSYLLMRRWLQNFAYRISIQPWIFLLSAATAFLIALLIISVQILKAALSDPVNSLRYE